MEKESKIKIIDEEIDEMKNLRLDFNNLSEKNRDMEIEINDLKDESEKIKHDFKAKETEFGTFKNEIYQWLSNELPKKDTTKDAVEIEESEQHKFEKCDFIGKTEGGLKVHVTKKHQTVLLRGYKKVTG